MVLRAANILTGMYSIRHVLSLIFLNALPIVMAQPDNSIFNFRERKDAAVASLRNYPRKDTARVNALIRVIHNATFSKEHKELLPYRKEAEDLSRKLDYGYGIAHVHFATANYLKTLSDYKNALRYYDSTLYVISLTVDPRLTRLKSLVLERAGTIYFNQENYYAALRYFFEVLKHDDQSRDARKIRAGIFIAESYYHLNNFEKASEFALRNIAQVEADTSLTGIRSSTYLTYIDICLAKNDLVLATKYLDKLAANANDPGEILVSFGYYMKRGHVNTRLGLYNAAYGDYQRAIGLARQGGHKSSISIALSHLSSTAFRLGNKQAAKGFALENLALADEMLTTAPRVEALINLANFYDASGNSSKAFELASQAIQLKDTLLSEMNIKQINLLGAIYEQETQRQEITALQLQQEQQVATVKQSMLLNWVFIGSIVMLLILGYLGYKNFRTGQELARNQQELQQQKIVELEKDKQLVSVNAMMKGQEEERSRIAKDLHDGFGGLLSGTRMSFVNVKERLVLTPEDRVLFEKSLSMLDNTILDLRKVAQNLMPEALVKFGLYDALRDYCDYVQSSTGLQMHYQQIGEQRKLDSSAEIFIFRIVQELVNNVVKHAGASQVIVQIATSVEKVHITVEDNGIGFDKSILSTAKGAGMANISYRVQCLNGRTDIVTSPGNGTSVNIELSA
jgi:two-component system NarL family sensor kinase